MATPILSGKKIAVLLETEFIPEEILAYQTRFPELGAIVDFMSMLWGKPSVRFVSDVDAVGESPEYLDISLDFQTVDIWDYAAVIMAANYTSVRLRYFQPPPGQPISPAQTRTAPAVQFFTRAMMNPHLIKGFLCHGLWILTPTPELLKDRRIICHEVVLADIANTGAIYVPSPTNIVVDGDLVTGRSGQDVHAFIEAIAQQIVRHDQGLPLLSYEQTLRQLEANKLQASPHVSLA